jgi:hypothetical protein
MSGPSWDFTPPEYGPDDPKGKEMAEYDRANLAAIFGIPAEAFAAETSISAYDIMVTMNAFERIWDEMLRHFKPPGSQRDDL